MINAVASALAWDNVVLKKRCIVFIISGLMMLMSMESHPTHSAVH